MKLLFATLAITLFPSAVHAVVPDNYPSTVFENDAQVTDIFKGMEDDFKQNNPWKLRFGSECTQRAETWTYELDKVKGIKSEKVFVFYTHAYQDYYFKKYKKNFKWWFHVSPYVLVKNAAGATEERVLDKEFSDAPQTMQEWTDIFIESHEKCIENVPFASFEGDVSSEGASYNKNAHCYIVRAPMYDMFPADADARERGTRSLMTWDMGQVHYAAKSLPYGERMKFYKRVGL